MKKLLSRQEALRIKGVIIAGISLMCIRIFISSLVVAEPSAPGQAQQWHQVQKHLAEMNKYLPEKLAQIQANSNSIGPKPAANYFGSPDGSVLTSTQAEIGGKLRAKLENPYGQCPRFKPKDCFCVEDILPPICETRYYQAVEYRFPLTLAEAGGLFQSDLIPTQVMRAYHAGLSRIINPEVLKEIYKQNYIWLVTGMQNQGAPSIPPANYEAATQHVQTIAASFTNIPEEQRFFAAWTAGQTPMIGYHAVPAILARALAQERALAQDIMTIIWTKKMPCGVCNRCAWLGIIYTPNPWAYKVHQLKTEEMNDPDKWFASEDPRNLALSYIPQTPGQMGAYGCTRREGAFFYNEDCTHRIKWPQRTHNLQIMNQRYLANQAECFQKELGAGGYLEAANIIPRGVFPAHKTNSFAGYNDDIEPCLPFNLGPRIQFATNTQGPVFNAQHLGSVGAFLAQAAGGYLAGQRNSRVPNFAESNLGLEPPYGELGGPDNKHDPYLFHKGNNIEGRPFTDECGSYAIPPLTGDYPGKQGFDKGLVLNNPNGVWIGSMWDWVRGFKRELTRQDCDFIMGSECRDFHYAY